MSIANYTDYLEEFTYRDFTDLIYKDDKGFISIFRKGFTGIFQHHYRKDAFNEKLDDFFAKDYTTDLYASINTFVTPERTLQSLRYLNALYIDIDCYKLKLRKESVLYFLENDFYGSVIPEPTLIVDSGRGLTLYWKIESVPSKALPLWKAMQHYLYKALKEFGADINALDAARVLRVIGSHNMKSYTDVKVIEYNKHNIYTLKGLKEDYLPKIEKKEKEKKEFKGKIIYKYNEFTLTVARLKDLEKLVELRNFDIDNREVFLFLYRYYAEILEGPETALEMATDLNSRLFRPLPMGELRSSTKSNHIGKYNYKNEKIIEMFSISEEEQKHLMTIKSQRVKYDKNNERRKANRRNSNGLTDKEQAKRDKLYSIFKGIKKDLKTKEIADILSVSTRLVQKYKKELENNVDLVKEFEKMYLDEVDESANLSTKELLISHIEISEDNNSKSEMFVEPVICEVYKDTGT